jgi:hypothetical protein
MTAADAQEPPYSVSRGVTKVDGRWMLTHAEWHPSSIHDVDIGQPETGVRRLCDGAAVPDSFALIQHGWWDFAAAEALIVRALRKGLDAERVATLMQWLEPRRRRKARVL